jgi:enoyl-CoA hydratase/carnithine racemase
MKDQQEQAFETVKVDDAGAVRIVTIDRPLRRNAISTQVLDEITAVVRDVQDDERVTGLILTGGPNWFSAGADLEKSQGVADGHARLQYLRRRHVFCDCLAELGKPVVAAIEGFCITFGLEIALACDLRIAGKGARFAITSSRIGTVAGGGGTQRLPRIVGLAPALEMLLGGESMEADEALRIGLIHRVVERGASVAAAIRAVEQAARQPAGHIAELKRMLQSGKWS